MYLTRLCCLTVLASQPATPLDNLSPLSLGDTLLVYFFRILSSHPHYGVSLRVRSEVRDISSVRAGALHKGHSTENFDCRNVFSCRYSKVPVVIYFVTTQDSGEIAEFYHIPQQTYFSPNGIPNRELFSEHEDFLARVCRCIHAGAVVVQNINVHKRSLYAMEKTATT